MKNLKSLYDLKNLIDLVEGFQVGWVAKIQMQSKTGERAQKLLLNFWKKHYDLMIENHNLRFKLKQAEDAYWQVQKMHDLWTRSQEMKDLKKGDCVVLENGRIADVLIVYDDDLVSVKFDDGTCDVVLRRYLRLRKGHLEGRKIEK